MQKRKNEYRPSQKILENYADVLVNFALNSGKSIKKGETVIVQCYEYAKPLYAEIVRTIWKSGGNVIPRYLPNNENPYNFERDFFTLAKKDQYEFFPTKFMKGLVDQADHLIYIESEVNKHALEGIEADKIIKRGIAYKPYFEWRRDKENKGKFTWTIGMYGTPAMAKEARLNLETYWEQIIKAVFLDKPNPIKEWKKVFNQVEQYRKKLSNLKIEKVHVLGPDVDLWVQIGEKRKWMGGSGRNIPSFEIFTSPDWRGTDGWIRFNQPLYRFGNLIEGIELEFKNGKVIRSKAKKNYNVLKKMIEARNADKIGEFSLTDRRFSRITKFMAETLYDENMGGQYGNTHIALGSSYHDCYDGNPANVKKEMWEKLGFNDSAIHTDIISTTPRRVMAYLRDGSQKLIYENGQFTL